MFKKIECGRCGNKVSEKYEFCPYCGYMLIENKRDLGMLGKDDDLSLDEMRLPTELNSLFNSLMKNLQKQLNKEMEKSSSKRPLKKTGVSIRISTSFDGKPKVKIDSFGDTKKQVKEKKLSPKTFSSERLRKFSSLQREEPKTDIRRLSKKVVYEIEMPGIKSINDISIVQLEQSIEIRGIAKDRSYFKLIPISMPITKYSLENDKLILEMRA